jgi:hypothetical protein
MATVGRPVVISGGRDARIAVCDADTAAPLHIIPVSSKVLTVAPRFADRPNSILAVGCDDGVSATVFFLIINLDFISFGFQAMCTL